MGLEGAGEATAEAWGCGCVVFVWCGVGGVMGGCGFGCGGLIWGDRFGGGEGR